MVRRKSDRDDIEDAKGLPFELHLGGFFYLHILSAENTQF